MDRAKIIEPKVLKEYKDTLKRMRCRLQSYLDLKNKGKFKYHGHAGQRAAYVLKKDIKFYETAIRNHELTLRGQHSHQLSGYNKLRKRITWRINCGCTYQDVADTLGLSKSMIEHIVAGYRPGKNIINKSAALCDLLQ